jgi:16S rRNA (uracil1498-N3)-methyltransferase
LKEGEEILVTDGCGTRATCSLSLVSKKNVLVRVKQTEVFDRPARELHLAIAPTKNMDRFEWLAEKATEMGITKITPLVCRHSERKELKTERVRKLILAAAKQSRQYWFPVLNEATPFRSVIAESADEVKLIAHCNDSEKVSLTSLAAAEKALVLIGPEGDFSEEEIAMALENGFAALSLGGSRLRTETAGLVTVAAFNFH